MKSKRISAFVLAAVLLLGCALPLGVLAADGENAGDTPEEPVAISTVEEFEAIKSVGNYYLANDIDFGGKTYDTWVIQNFSGTLDGRGHTIWNFAVSSAADGERVEGGLFQYIGSEADTVIKDLQIGKPGENVQFTFADAGWAYGGLAAAHGSANYALAIEGVTMYADVSVSNGNNINVGGFLGASMNCVMRDCALWGSVSGATTNSWINVAGFSANPKKVTGGAFERCVNYADITVSNSTTARAGGIVGYAAYGINLTGCYNFGRLSVANTEEGKEVVNARLGGIIAENAAADRTGVYEGCFNFGEVVSPKHAGGIVGYNCKDVTVKNCINFGVLTGADENIPVGAIYGYSESEIVAEGNKDLSGRFGDPVSDALGTVGTQTTAPEENRFDIRFLSTVDSRNYHAVGFDVEIFCMEDGTLVSRTLRLTSHRVFESVCAKNAQGEDITVEAAELGGQYVNAISVFDVPTEADYGSITFVFRPYAENGDTVVYGSTAVAVYNGGTLVFTAAAA